MRRLKFRKIVRALSKPLLYAVAAAAIFSLGGFSAYYYLKQYAPAPSPISGVTNLEEGKPPGVDFSVFWDTWRAIQNQYVGRNNLDAQKMVWGAAEGLVQSLGDPYSSFLSPAEYKDFTTSLSGKFEGIGIEIGSRKGVLTVIAPLEGTPAKEAGLASGDQILKIDDTPTGGLTLDEAVKMIRGPKGTRVKLSIMRQGWNEAKDFVITRGIIDIKSVTWEPIDQDIALINIHNFNEKSFDEFRDVAGQVAASGRDKIILDLRDDPGGYFESAIYIAGWFLKRGDVAVKESEGEEPFVCRGCRANGNGAFLNHKVVVLINGGSASASEILAGALRDNRGIKLIGEKTFGKGSVQEIKDIRGGAAVKITVAKWLTPSGTDITEKGLAPDFEVKNPADGGADLQLEKAKEIVRNL